MPRDYLPWFLDTVSWISQILSAISIPLVAWVGYHSWKRELKGKARFDVAKSLVLSAMEFADKFKAARNPATFAGEYVGRVKEEGEDRTEGLGVLADEEYARRKRLIPVREAAVLLRRAQWEAEVLLSVHIATQIDPIVKHYSQLYADVTVHFQAHRMYLLHHGGLQDQTQNSIGTSRIYWVPGDEIEIELDRQIDALKAALKRYLA